MAAVCRSWQTSLKHRKPKFPICLMLGEKEDDNDDRRCFVTALEDKVMEFELSEIRKRRCWGTPFGREHGRYTYDNEEDGIVIENCCFTEGFGMVRLETNTRNRDEISSLGDRSLFLGNCWTFTVLASDYYGCISNCIYFTYDFLYDDYHDLEGTNCGGGIDTGIYHCDDKEALIRLPDVGDDDQPFRYFPLQFGSSQVLIDKPIDL
ncbi:hypothetical protein CCACVL1_28363 [Corchorus capsularis]|uniref:KIB1-4 beta-propeller domain-containing protein n=1 Tax=Corchorus capsularis TaxID=210143 RepID=A0A1R3G6Q8_COCAP|nr:hypothetical protein CCACVL1_28363 [Corchorus capsularis]